MGFVADILMPALPILAKMEESGIPLSIPTRDRYTRDAERRLAAAQKEIRILAQQYHEKRIERLRISRVGYLEEARILANELKVGRCLKHEHTRRVIYLTRAECADCCWSKGRDPGKVYAHFVTLRKKADVCRDKLKMLGPTFITLNDWHWRFLLFDELGLNLEPVTRTVVTETMRKKGIEEGTPKVDDDAIAKLRRKHPDIPLLRLRVEISETRTRLNSRLNVVPGEGWPKSGRVHAPYALHRTWNQRLSCGDDDSDSDKVYEGEGHMQNVPKRDRAMYRAEPGYIFLQPDMSQFQARIQAWLAHDDKMMNAWKAGKDIHEITAATIYENDPKMVKYPTWEEKCKATRVEEVLCDGDMKPMREMGKRRRHGTNCGMGPGRFADMTGISKSEAYRIADLDRKAWPKEHEYQEWVLEYAAKHKCLINAFGMKNYFYSFEKRKGKWGVKDPGDALSFNMASLESCMIIKMLPEVNYLEDNFGKDQAELLTSTHDSYLIQLVNDPTIVLKFMKAIRAILEQEWPKMGFWQGMALPSRGKSGNLFWCPVDFKLGFNWGEKHTCKEKCAKEYKTEALPHPKAPLARDGQPCIDYNPDGLIDFDERSISAWPEEINLDRAEGLAA